LWSHAKKILNGFTYFATSIDDYLQFTVVYFLNRKFDVFSIYQFYKAIVETQIGNKIKCLRFDNGGEYTSSHFIKFCEDHGIFRQYIVPYTLEQNGVLE
jgi:transposase InsO family protein